MRQFNYFENGGPYPGSCVVTGDNKNLISLDVQIPTYGNVMLNRRTVEELAYFIGYAPKEPMVKEVEHLRLHIKQLEARLNAVPSETENLINGIRNSVADFILTVSSSSDDGGSVSVQDDSGDASKPARPRKTKSSNDQASS